MFQSHTGNFTSKRKSATIPSKKSGGTFIKKRRQPRLEKEPFEITNLQTKYQDTLNRDELDEYIQLTNLFKEEQELPEEFYFTEGRENASHWRENSVVGGGLFQTLQDLTRYEFDLSFHNKVIKLREVPLGKET